MTVVGCLLPLMLMVVGSLLGAILGDGGVIDARWGAGGGFVLGCIGAAGVLWGWKWITRLGGYDTRE
jgi:hypothetical protein